MTERKPRLCVVGPGRHAPVLGSVTEHVIHSLRDRWEISTVQLAVPDDEYDWTLIGLNTPALVSVPSIVETASQLGGQRRRCRRFFFRQLPDVVLIDWWTLRQSTAISAIVSAAHDAGAKVAVRCCGNLPPGSEPVRRFVAERVLARADLVIGRGASGSIHRAFEREWALPEWATEKRPASAEQVNVVAFLPSTDLGPARLVLQAFAGLSQGRAHPWRLHLATRSNEDLRALDELVAAHPHAGRLGVLTKQLSDVELGRWMRHADIAVVFEPDWSSRALEHAERYGIPVVVARDRGMAGPGDGYCGAAVSARDAASVLAAIERANLARQYRYPDSHRWRQGAERLTVKLLSLVDGGAALPSTLPRSDLHV